MALSAIQNNQIFSVGDSIRVHQKIKETTSKGERTRIQGFDGLVIAIRGENVNKSFTVRRIGAGNIGIEKIFPLFSPLIEKIEVLAKGHVRRSKLYYLRDKTQKEVADITKRYSRRKAQVQSSMKPKKKVKSKLRAKKKAKT